MVFRGLGEVFARLAVVGILIAGVWVLLQFYTEEELVQAGRDFWAWWSTRLTGELGTYWNPVGAGVALAVIVFFVTAPISRLFRGNQNDAGHYDSYGGDDGDGGDGD